MARQRRIIRQRKVKRNSAVNVRNVLNVFVILAIVALVAFGLYTSPNGITGAAVSVGSAGAKGTFLGLAIVAVGLLLSYAHIRRNK